MRKVEIKSYKKLEIDIKIARVTKYICMTKSKWIQKIIGIDRRIASFEISSAFFPTL